MFEEWILLAPHHNSTRHASPSPPQTPPQPISSDRTFLAIFRSAPAMRSPEPCSPHAAGAWRIWPCQIRTRTAGSDFPPWSAATLSNALRRIWPCRSGAAPPSRTARGPGAPDPAPNQCPCQAPDKPQGPKSPTPRPQPLLPGPQTEGPPLNHPRPDRANLSRLGPTLLHRVRRVNSVIDHPTRSRIAPLRVAC
jgi:hypothetical protein